MLYPGAAAPPFTAQDHEGREVDLADYREQWVVLWWFAKASTSG